PRRSTARATSAPHNRIGPFCPLVQWGVMPEPVTPSVGWGVLHLFCKVKPEADGEAILTAVKAAQGDDHQVVTFAVLGHKADLGFLAAGPDLWRLRARSEEHTSELQSLAYLVCRLLPE